MGHEPRPASNRPLSLSVTASRDQVNAAVDAVIGKLLDNPNAVIAIPIPSGLSARERGELIDRAHHVVHEIRWRNWPVKGQIRGQTFLIALEGRRRNVLAG
jgi:hypothetical protein